MSELLNARNDARLFQAIIAGGVAITGMSVGTVGVAASVTVQPSNLQAAAQPIIDAFDWSQAAQDAADGLDYRAGAKALASTDHTAPGKALRVLLGILLDEINILRAAVVHPASSITRSGTTATVTTPTAHGLATGDQVAMWGADQAIYNGLKTITVTDATHFTYNGVTGNPTTPATGSLFYLMGVPPATNPRTIQQLKTAFNNRVDVGDLD